MNRYLVLFSVLLWGPVFATDKPTGPKSDIISTSCPMLLRGVPLDQYLSAIRSQEITPASLSAAEEKMVEYFKQIALRSPNLNAIVPRIQVLLQNYSAAVSSWVRGLDEISRSYQVSVASALRLEASAIENAVRAAAEDPKIYRAFSVAEFVMQRQPSIEAYLLSLALRDEKLSSLEFSSFEQGGQFLTASVLVGPRQIEMIRTVLQYSTTRPNEKVLEIGYHSPAVALGVARFTQTKVTAVDRLVPPENANEVLSPKGVELIQGQFPDTTLEQLRAKGSFKVIMALDTIKAAPGVLQTSVSPQTFVESLYSLLDGGGHLIIVNDFSQPPVFTRDQAEAAGFKVVRWGFNQHLTPALKQLMPYDPNASNAGVLATFVLRKGDVAEDDLRLSRDSQKK